MTDLTSWRQEGAEIIAEMVNDGFNPNDEYLIEHHFAGEDFEQLEKAAVDLFKAGFEVTDAEEMELDDGAQILCFDVLTDRPLQLEVIMSDIEKILPIIAKYDVEYDGWGCSVEEE